MDKTTHGLSEKDFKALEGLRYSSARLPTPERFTIPLLEEKLFLDDTPFVRTLSNGYKVLFQFQIQPSSALLRACSIEMLKNTGTSPKDTSIKQILDALGFEKREMKIWYEVSKSGRSFLNFYQLADYGLAWFNASKVVARDVIACAVTGPVTGRKFRFDNQPSSKKGEQPTL